MRWVLRKRSIDARKEPVWRYQYEAYAPGEQIEEYSLPEYRDVHGAPRVIVVGAGPAGMTCAFYLAEKGYKPTVFEKNPLPGGMLVYGIPQFVLEKDVVAAEIDVMREMGVDIKCGVEVGKDVTLAQLREQGYKAFYIAIGCQGGRKVGVPGEDSEGS